MGFPVVASVTPDRGPKAGGTSVTILGRNFTGTTSVEFGGVPAASFTVDDDNTISAVTPLGASVGDVDVTLVNADGSSAGGIDLNDSSGNGHHGAYGFFPTWRSGLVPGGDAAGDGFVEASFSIADAIIDPAADFTIEYWGAAPPGPTIGVVAGSVDAGLSVAGPVTDVTVDGIVAMSVGGVGWGAVFNSAASMVEQSPFPVDGDPHHLVLVSETNGDISLYIDGSFVETQINAPKGAGTPMSVTSGEAQAGASIDELAFYPTALSGGDVAANFAAASVSYDGYLLQVLSLSPEAFYRFDDERESGSFEFVGPEGWHVGRIGVGV